MSNNITIDMATGGFVGAAPANQADLMRQAEGYVSVAQSFVIDSQEMRALALDEVTTLKRKKKELEEQRMSITRPMDAAKDAVMALFRAPNERLDLAISTINSGIIEFDASERKKAEAERRRLEVIAEAERQRLAAIAEEERRKAAELAAAAAAKEAEEKRKRDELIAAAEAENARLKAEAEAAARAGDIATQQRVELEAQEKARIAAEEAHRMQLEQEERDRAAAIAKHEAEERARAAELAQASTSAAIIAPVANSKGTRTAWKGKCSDKMALLKFIVANPSYMHLVDVNESALNQTAKAQKDAMKIDGCIAYEERTVVASRK